VLHFLVAGGLEVKQQHTILFLLLLNLFSFRAITGTCTSRSSASAEAASSANPSSTPLTLERAIRSTITQAVLPDPVTTLILGYAKARPTLAAGGFHSLVLLDDGTVMAFGYNSNGQLGDGSTTNWLTPVRVNLGGNKAQAIAAGYYHSLILLDDGTVMAFGYNAAGQLGDGSTTNRLTPVRVNLGGNKAQAIAAGYYHSLILLDDGTVMAFGENPSGQLGDGSTTSRLTPVRVNLGDNKAQAIAAGVLHSLVLLDDGTVMAFGYNSNGQLGDGSTTTRLTPVRVNLGDNKAQAIAAGDHNSLVLLDDGTVMAFGYNSYGQLGDGSTTDRLTPVRVNLDGNKAQAIAAGAHHSLVLLDDRTVMAFGYNSNGRLGDGSTTNRLTPVRVNLGGNKAQAIAAGDHHSLILLDDGTLMAFGGNANGQLGDGSTTNRLTPVRVNLGGKTALTIPTGLAPPSKRFANLASET